MRKTFVPSALLLATMTLFGCNKQSDAESADNMEEDMEEATEDTEDALDEAADDTEDAFEDAAEETEETFDDEPDPS